MFASIRSFFARWLGGAGAEPVVVPPAQAGYRGFLAFWMGGAAPGPALTPPPPVLVGGIGGGFGNYRFNPPGYKTPRQIEDEKRERRRKKRIEVEDEEILLLI